MYLVTRAIPMHYIDEWRHKHNDMTQNRLKNKACTHWLHGVCLVKKHFAFKNFKIKLHTKLQSMLQLHNISNTAKSLKVTKGTKF